MGLDPLTVFMRFIADSMLGRLATWLRIMGYDTIYDPCISDRDLIDRARRDGRIILTRDTQLIKRRLVKDYLFIRSNYFKNQLKEVVEHFSLDPLAHFLSLCIRCNTSLIEISKERVRERVPLYVFRTQEDFRQCPQCNRVYWGATHKREMEKELRRLFKIT